MNIKNTNNFNEWINIKDTQWVNDFLTQKSGISAKDETIQAIAKAILSFDTLKELVQTRYLDGNRFIGWTKDGSRGFTDISTGDIWIGKTGTGTESITLGYECINSKNRLLYRKIGIKYAFEEKTLENREKFAQEILEIEAQAMYLKCKLATEMGKRKLIKDYYLEIYDNPELEDYEKISKLKDVMIEKGLVHVIKPAYKFYQEERYDEVVGYYRDQINKGNIT